MTASNWIDELLVRLPDPDDGARAVVMARAAEVLRPSGAFARLDAVAGWLAAWHGSERPAVTNPAVVVFLGDHGVTAEGVSAYPAGVTRSMLDALRGGVATINVLAEEVGATLSVVDVGVDRPTGNIAVEPALDDERFAVCFEQGRSAVRALDADLLVVGEMGIGNTTCAAAVALCLFGSVAEDWTGLGSGIDEGTLRHKVAVVQRARDRVGDCGPIEALRQLGGAEMAAMAGAVLEARLRRLPVLLDGFVVTAAVAALEVARPGALDHCIAGHRSPEPGHQLLLEKLGREPLLDLGLRLGEGTGAVAAIPLARMAARAVVDVATFDEWGLSR
jgi:nicotinate-nucleotide--dimethylbenzimidazole phosphoribosyltransferase